MTQYQTHPEVVFIRALRRAKAVVAGAGHKGFRDLLQDRVKAKESHVKDSLENFQTWCEREVLQQEGQQYATTAGKASG